MLGTALALKMIAYVAIAPVAGAYAGAVPRKALLVGCDRPMERCPPADVNEWTSFKGGARAND